MKSFAVFALSTLAMLSMTACQINMDDKPKSTDPVYNEEDVLADRNAIEGSELVLKNMGIEFKPEFDGAYTVKEVRISRDIYNDYQARNPVANNSEKLVRLQQESEALGMFVSKVRMYVTKYPGTKFNMKRKVDGTISEFSYKPNELETMNLKAKAAKDERAVKESAIENGGVVPTTPPAPPTPRA